MPIRESSRQLNPNFPSVKFKYLPLFNINMTETITLQDLYIEIGAIAQKIISIEENVAEIHEDLHQVKPEYLEKLEKIKQELGKRFSSKEAFLHYVEHEL